MAHEEITRRLDTIISLIKLAHHESLSEARADALSDPVTAALVEAASGEFLSAGKLKGVVAKATRQSEKTVQRRISDLVAMGVLEKRPTGQAAYRSTGVF